MRRDSNFILAENMVLALERYYGSYHIQDMVHVTSSGHRLISNKISTEGLWSV